MSAGSGAASQPQMPPWIQEQIEKFQKTQEELHTISMQKRQLEMEKINAVRTLEELKKVNDDESVFKMTGSVFIKTTKVDMISDLTERQELAGTRADVTAKQEVRLKESLKEQEAKITEIMRKGPAAMSGAGAASSPPPSTQ